MARVKTFTNGGSMLPGDLNSIQDDYEKAFSSYKVIARKYATFQTSDAAATYVLADGNSPVGTAANTTPIQGLHLDPADFAASPRTTRMRLRAVVTTNAVAPAITFTFGLHPVSDTGGASNAYPTMTLGAATSTVVIATPSADTYTPSPGADFAAPTAGLYVLAVLLSGSVAANSKVAVWLELQVRQT